MFKCLPFQLPFQEDDSASIAAANAAGTASPLTARSMRLERVAHALAQSQEELLKYAQIFNRCFPKPRLMFYRLLTNYIRSTKTVFHSSLRSSSSDDGFKIPNCSSFDYR